MTIDKREYLCACHSHGDVTIKGFVGAEARIEKFRLKDMEYVKGGQEEYDGENGHSRLEHSASSYPCCGEHNHSENCADGCDQDYWMHSERHGSYRYWKTCFRAMWKHPGLIRGNLKFEESAMGRKEAEAQVKTCGYAVLFLGFVCRKTTF
jgi:hypothetical protein